MELAAEIHHILVPAIDTKIGEFEFYGRSVPSGEAGGDLIDVFQNDHGWIAYVADVSGHGVASWRCNGHGKQRGSHATFLRRKKRRASWAP
jgi:serine phosphatase RsbU (regulator of sigma subunit)